MVDQLLRSCRQLTFHKGINGNTNTLAWAGDTPSPDTTGTFVAWLSNPDVNLLSGVQALSAQSRSRQRAALALTPSSYLPDVAGHCCVSSRSAALRVHRSHSTGLTRSPALATFSSSPTPSTRLVSSGVDAEPSRPATPADTASDVWATSQPFEIKAANSPYPPGAASAGAPQVTATASGSAVAGASGAAGNASHSGASAAPSASTKPSSAGILAVAPVAVAAVAGAAAYIVV